MLRPLSLLLLVREADTSRTQRIVRRYLDLLEAQNYCYSEAFEQTVSALYTLPGPNAAQPNPTEPRHT